MIKEICRREHEETILRDIFNMFDLNKDGYISRDELIKILVVAGDSRQQAELTADELLLEAGCRYDGKVNYRGEIPCCGLKHKTSIIPEMEVLSQ